MGGWVAPRAGLDNVKRKFLIIPGLELQTLGRPARSQSLYWLRYPDSEYEGQDEILKWFVLNAKWKTTMQKIARG
jgi:hypothetical protein